MNHIGRLFQINIFGESHGSSVGILLDGVKPGIKLSNDDFKADLLRRKSDPNMTKSSTSICITNLSNFKSKIKSGKSLSKQEYDELKKIYKDFFEVDDATDN